VNSLLALTASTGERINPIAVKEFRQAVQNRLVLSVLMLSLLINLAVLGGYLILIPNADTSPDGGRNVFTILTSIMQFICLAFVPLYAGGRLALERNNANNDLLYITTITPGAIVRGKYLAAMGLTALIYSACLPFLTITYLLRGIDLFMIFFMLAGGFVTCAAANAAGIFIGAIQISWIMRVIAAVAMIWGLSATTLGTMGMTGAMIMFGAGIPWDSWAYRAGSGTYLRAIGVGIGVAHVLSIAMLSPKTTNRMFVPRLYITGCWALGAVVAGLWGSFTTSLEPVVGWVIVNGIAWMVCLAGVTGERDDWSIRVRRKIPRNPAMRFMAFLFFTGSAGGVLWCVLFFALTILAAYGWSEWLTKSSGRMELIETCTNTSIVFGYILCYCLTAAFLRVVLLRKWSTQIVPVTAALIGLSASFGPYLIAFLESRLWWDNLPWYLLGSPLVLTAPSTAPVHNVVGVFVMTWFILGAATSAPWFLGQWRRFRPHRAAAVPLEPQMPAAAELAETGPAPMAE